MKALLLLPAYHFSRCRILFRSVQSLHAAVVTTSRYMEKFAHNTYGMLISMPVNYRVFYLGSHFLPANRAIHSPSANAHSLVCIPAMFWPVFVLVVLRCPVFPSFSPVSSGREPVLSFQSQFFRNFPLPHSLFRHRLDLRQHFLCFLISSRHITFPLSQYLYFPTSGGLSIVSFYWSYAHCIRGALLCNRYCRRRK